MSYKLYDHTFDSILMCTGNVTDKDCVDNACPYCPPKLAEGDYSNGFVRPSVCSQSVCRHSLVSATPPTIFKGF